MERDNLPLLTKVSNDYFNSHAHVERDEILSDCLNDGEDFNSHAHVERDAGEWAARGGIKISTHTLTWSVTVLCAEDVSHRIISTHTLTWSVTPFLSLFT